MTPGIHRIPPADYHADRLAPEPSLSSTVARLLVNRSPLHAWTAHPRLNPDYEPEVKDAFDIGRVAHRLILGRGDEFCTIPGELLDAAGGARTTAAKDFIASARAAGMTPLKQEQADACVQMADACVRRMREAGMGLDAERSELTALAQIDNVWCRMMADNAPAGRPYLIDVKTTMNAAPEACRRSIADYEYAIQAAHYVATWEAATGERRRMRFVMVEKEPPHEVSIVELAPEWIATAASKIAEARRIWRECIDADEWPGFPHHIAVLEPPPWYEADWAARETGMPITKASRAALAAAYKAQAPVPAGE